MTVEVARPLCRGYNIRAFATALTLFLLCVCVCALGRAWWAPRPSAWGRNRICPSWQACTACCCAARQAQTADGDAWSSGDGSTGLLLRDFAFSDGDATGGAATAATGMVPSPGGGGAGGGAALAADALANGFTARAFALRAHRQWDQADALEVRGGKLGVGLYCPFGAPTPPS
jgi:hypothetical protein